MRKTTGENTSAYPLVHEYDQEGKLHAVAHRTALMAYLSRSSQHCPEYVRLQHGFRRVQGDNCRARHRAFLLKDEVEVMSQPQTRLGLPGRPRAGSKGGV